MYTEKDIGILSFLSHSPGVGGKLRKEIDDFYVEEIPLPVERKENGRNLFMKVKLRNWETNRFVKVLSKFLGVSRHRILFAGNKDKRAVTVQYFCILNYKGDIEISVKDVEILETFRSDATLKMGSLYGNKFKLILRDANCDERIERIEKELEGKFPNFFGVQRFGASRPITHTIGKFIVLGNFKEAVRYYVGFPSDFQEDEGRRIFFENMDPLAAIKEIDRKASFERAILNHLITHPNDFVGALKNLPNNLLLLFVHGYQSYLFNLMVSRRLEYGVEVREGDVIMKTDELGLPVQEFVKVSSFNLDKIRHLISRGKAYVSTVLFGYNTQFSGGLQGEIEKEIIESEGIRRDMFRIREIRELSSKGRRRNIIAPVENYERRDCEFRFVLHRGSYATSLMREFMKTPALEFY